MMKGRQALWIIYEHLRLSDGAGALYDLQDLISVKLNSELGTGDRGSAKAPEEDLLEPLFLDQIKGSQVLKS